MKHYKLLIPVMLIVSLIFFVLSYFVYFIIDRKIGITLFASVFGFIITIALFYLLNILSKISK